MNFWEFTELFLGLELREISRVDGVLQLCDEWHPKLIRRVILPLGAFFTDSICGRQVANFRTTGRPFRCWHDSLVRSFCGFFYVRSEEQQPIIMLRAYRHDGPNLEIKSDMDWLPHSGWYNGNRLLLGIDFFFLLWENVWKFFKFYT